MVNILIIRDARESVKKCSVAPLKGSRDITIRGWHRDHPIEVGGHTLLHPEGEPLTAADACRPLLVVDSSWHHLAQVSRDLTGIVMKRSIPPGFATAYPRKSRVFDDPETGLASVEALFVALVILGEWREELLNHYHFKDAFLRLNEPRFSELAKK